MSMQELIIKESLELETIAKDNTHGFHILNLAFDECQKIWYIEYISHKGMPPLSKCSSEQEANKRFDNWQQQILDKYKNWRKDGNKYYER